METFKNKRQFLDLMEYLWDISESKLSISSMMIQRGGTSHLYELHLPNGKEISFNKVACDVKNHKWDSETFCNEMCSELNICLPKAKNISFNHCCNDNVWTIKIDDETLDLQTYYTIHENIRKHSNKPNHTNIVIYWKQYMEKLNKHCDETRPADTGGWN